MGPCPARTLMQDCQGYGGHPGDEHFHKNESLSLTWKDTPNGIPG